MFRKSGGGRTQIAFVFIVDRSGSMSGVPWETVGNLIRETASLIPKKRKDVLISLVFFNSSVQIEEARSREDVERVLARVTPSGGTMLFTAMERTLPRLQRLSGVPHLCVEVLTDDMTADDQMRESVLRGYTEFFRKRALESRYRSTQVIVRRWGRAANPLAVVEQRLRTDRRVRSAIRSGRLQIGEAAPSVRVERPTGLRAALGGNSGAGGGPSPYGEERPLRPEIRDQAGQRVQEVQVNIRQGTGITPKLRVALPDGFDVAGLRVESDRGDVVFGSNGQKKLPGGRGGSFDLRVRREAPTPAGILLTKRRRLAARLIVQSSEGARPTTLPLTLILTTAGLIPNLLRG